MKGYFQHDENDCGLACVFTVCRMLKIKFDETDIRKDILLGQEGLSLYGLTKVFGMLGVQTDAVEGSLIELEQEYNSKKQPMIVLINENYESHYVVLTGIKKEKMYIWDPNIGIRRLPKAFFEEIWSGYGVCISITFDVESNLKCKKKSNCLSELIKDKRLIGLIIAFSGTLMLISMGTSYLYKEVIDGIGDRSFFSVEYLGYFAGLGMAYIIMYGMYILKERLIAYERTRFGVRLQNRFVESVLQMPLLKADDYSSGGILDRFYRLNNVGDIMISFFVSIILEVVSLLAGTVILIRINAVMFLMTLSIVVAYLLAYVFSRKKLFYLNKTLIDRQATLTTHMNEMLANIVTLKSCQCPSYQKKLSEENEKIKNLGYRIDKTVAFMGGTLDAVENLAMLTVLAYGLYMVSMNEMTLGTVLAFEGFVGFFLSPVKSILGILPSLPEIFLTLRKTDDVLVFSDGVLKEKTDYKIQEQIVVKNIDVMYGFEPPILKDVSFQIGKGISFIVGNSGCGKTTLAKMVAGLIDVPKGKVYWDGIYETKDVNEKGQVLYLSQETELFSGTIKENILLWNQTCDEELLQDVLRHTGVEKIVENKVDGLEGYVSEQGGNLSGGEKQRIALARAFMSDAKVFIFDESTCHLDSQSEKDIICFIREQMKDKICLFITHNMDLIDANDNVLYIDSLGNVCNNTHRRLLNENENYRKMIGIGV